MDTDKLVSGYTLLLQQVVTTKGCSTVLVLFVMKGLNNFECAVVVKSDILS